MKKFISTLIPALALGSYSADEGSAPASDKLHFVFEVVRHGGRAPEIDNYGFDVLPGMLTA